MQLVKFQYHPGITTECFTARLRYKGKGLNLAYDCHNDYLVVYRGYLFPQDEMQFVVDRLKPFLRTTYQEKRWNELPKVIEFGT